MLIGIVGTHGAGKGAVVGILKEYGFLHCSSRELFIDALREKGITEPDRNSISVMANELRAQHGVAYVVEEYTRRHNPLAHDLIIESIYTLGEAAAIREHGGFVLAVDADPELRYERISHRMSETDFVSKEEFMRMQEQEARSDDPTKQNSRAVMHEADFHIYNNGSMEELQVQVNTVLEKMKTAEAAH